MEQLKVIKKDALVLNMILFLMMSFVFLYLQYAYRHHLSPVSLAYLKKSIELFWYVLFPLGTCSLLVWKHRSWSLPIYVFCVALVSYKVVEGVFIEFNKIIIIALFFYIVISYFLYQLFKSYLSLASLNANYSPTDLFNPLLREMKCHLWLDDEELAGELTNWDEEGCFVKLKGANKKIPTKVKLVIEFKDRRFEQQGEVVAHSMDYSGVGIKFGVSPKGLKVFNWAEFNELVYELGYKPERLR